MPQSHFEDGYRLGDWVSAQRRSYHEGRLSADHTARLEALLGWTWNARDDEWEEGFSSLGQFVARLGHARVPQSHFEDGYRLGRWTSSQRTNHRAGRLSAERITRLEALPGWTWDTRKKADA